MQDIPSFRFKRLHLLFSIFYLVKWLLHIEIHSKNYLPLVNNLQILTNNEGTDKKNRIKTEGPKLNTTYH